MRRLLLTNIALRIDLLMAAGETKFMDDLEIDKNDEGGVTASTVIRVLIADSQAIYRVGMRKIFALEDDLRVVSQVGFHQKSSLGS